MPSVSPSTPQGPPQGATPNAPVTAIVPGQGVIVLPQPGAPSPAEVYEGLRQQRRVLRGQLEELTDQRRDLASNLIEPNRSQLSAGDVKGMEQRLANIDQRIVGLDKQIAENDAALAQAAAVPGAIVEPTRPPQQGPPEEAWVLGGMFIVVVLLPLTVAYARRIWRRAGAVVSLPQEIYDRFTRLEQSIDSIAIEVERVGEGQRFLTRMQAQQERALGPGGVEPVEARARELEHRARP